MPADTPEPSQVPALIQGCPPRWEKMFSGKASPRGGIRQETPSSAGVFPASDTAWPGGRSRRSTSGVAPKARWELTPTLRRQCQAPPPAPAFASSRLGSRGSGAARVRGGEVAGLVHCRRGCPPSGSVWLREAGELPARPPPQGGGADRPAPPTFSAPGRLQKRWVCV